MTHDPWITLAASRARVWLVDGREGVLVGVPRKKGPRARVQLPSGDVVTVKLVDIVGVEQQLEGVQ